MSVAVLPDLKAQTHRKRRSTEVPVKAVEWALQQCERHLQSKSHHDIDSKVNIVKLS